MVTITEEKLRRAVRVFEENQVGSATDIRDVLRAVLVDWEESREFERQKQVVYLQQRREVAPNLDAYIDRACDVTGVAREELLSRSRMRRITGARTEVWIALRAEGLTTLQIGRAFGRDHSTVVELTKAYTVGPAERERINWIRGIQQSAEAA